MPRIKTRPDELRDQLTTASAAALAAGASWPASAPSPAVLTGAATDINVESGTELMKLVDEATDFLYGPGGAQKLNFGLPPKGTPESDELHKLVEIRTTDGLPAHSIFFDWESIKRASYEIQWFTDSALTNMVGSAVSTQSEFTITGLTAGTQYWMVVRPIRGSAFGPWSDPATRIAPA